MTIHKVIYLLPVNAFVSVFNSSPAASCPYRSSNADASLPYLEDYSDGTNTSQETQRSWYMKRREHLHNKIHVIGPVLTSVPPTVLLSGSGTIFNSTEDEMVA